MNELSYFTDTAFKYSQIIGSLWTLHSALLVGAMGWAAASRQWKAAVEIQLALIAGAVVLGLGAVNVLGISDLVLRANSALEQAQLLWRAAHPTGTLPHMLDRWPFSWPMYIGIDLVVAAIVVYLLSGAGRGSATPHDDKGPVEGQSRSTATR